MNVWKLLWRIFFRDFRTTTNTAERNQTRLAMRGAARFLATQKRIRE